ncbi:MAG: protein kinase domain-containing protein, partial [Pseudonocardiaceae bacterium]
ALQAAHAAGITHRDVKPGNVLMAHDGRIKLTDFGIAHNGSDQTLTATGLMLGSPAYIAPEIASGGPVNPASDLWGLGATLFAAVEGRPPYDAGTAMATVAAVVRGEVPRPSCTGALAEVIHGLMVKDPVRRMPLARVRQLLGAPPESADPGTANLDSAAAPVPVTVAPQASPQASPQAPEPTRQPTGRLAADPGPLPFAVPSTVPSSGPIGTRRPATAHRRVNTKVTGAGRRMVLWTLAVLLFLGTATGGFGLARLASGRAALPSLSALAFLRSLPHLGALPYLGTRVASGTSSDDVVLTPRTQQITEPDSARAAQFTVRVPWGWPEFREQRTLGNDSSTVMRFVSPDGSEVIAVERVTGALPGGDVDHYLTTYLRALSQVVPELVETQRQRMPGGALDATFRTREGGELRRTTYLRLIPAGPDLWAVSVTVPTEREAAGRMRLFEPVLSSFAPTSSP